MLPISYELSLVVEADMAKAMGYLAPSTSGLLRSL